METIDTNETQNTITLLNLAENLANQVIAVSEKYNSLQNAFEEKLSEALELDAIEDQLQIATEAERLSIEARAQVEAEYQKTLAQQAESESKSIGEILTKLSAAGISI